MKKTLIYLLFGLFSIGNFAFGQNSDEITAEVQLPTQSRKDLVRPDYYKIHKDSVYKKLSSLPSFNMYRDNYFISGIPTNKDITRNTADAKFQISISQRLTNYSLPFETSLAMTYTQKSYWDIFANSSPFRDNNYNPGLSFSKLIIKNNELRGIASLSLEHESNGLDSLASRAWNFLGLSVSYFFNKYFTVQAKLWLPYVSRENSDLLDYRGLGMLAVDYRSENDRWWCSLILNPNNKFSVINTTVEVNYKVSERHNQYLFLQYYSGYAESLLYYKEYASMIRIGMSIKPPLRSVY